ncbi:Uncharacterised protein [uncultured archaeon]|nr:Uncharacterised protein [uncultured archaeon]
MLSGIAISDSVILVILLAVFIVVGYKVLTILRNAIIIAVLAAIFPYALNYFGAHFSTTISSEIRYIAVALGLYLIYEIIILIFGIGRFFWAALKILATPIVWIGAAIKKLLFGGKKEEKEEKKGKGSEKEKEDENKKED